MEEVKKTAQKKTSNTSKVRKVSKRKIPVSDLSSDELMEQILAKKKNKTINNTHEKKSGSINKNSSGKNNGFSKKVNDFNEELSSDELYDLIKAKRNVKKKKSVISEDSKVQVENSSLVNNNDFIEEKYNVQNSNVNGDIDLSDGNKEVETYDKNIITREIIFDEDSVDLNNKKLLKQLGKAIEEFDDLNKIDDESSDEDNIPVETKRIDKTSFLNSKIFMLFSCIFLILLFVVIIFLMFGVNKDENFEFKPNVKKYETVDNRPQLYDECLKRNYSDADNSGDVILTIERLNDYLKSNYDVSVMYEELSTGFSYSYNDDVVYYAASTIKSLDALYIYTKAANGEIDLDDTMTYSSKYKWSSSKEMSKYNYGDKVSIRNLVKYAIIVSDNTAHQMLVSYIGKDNLKDFGRSLGALYTLEGSDNFGSISVADAIIYMKAINDFINENGELGKELQSYFVGAEQNGLEFSDLGISAAHKYGEYSYYYHDIGIVYDEHPYVIAILTHEGNNDYLNIIKDINEHIYELQNIYYNNREQICNLEIYGS